MGYSASNAATTAATIDHATAGEVPAQDPEHDVDGKQIALWLVCSTAGVFLTVWALSFLYGAALQWQRERVIDGREPVERQALRSEEDLQLGGGAGRVDIETALQRYVESKK